MAGTVEIQGRAEIQTGTEATTIVLDGNTGNINLGGNGQDGNLQFHSSAGANTIFMGGEEALMLMGNVIRLEGKSSRVVAKDLQLRSSSGENSIFLGGDSSTILLGNTLKLDGKTGSIFLKDWTLSVPDYVFAEDYKLRELDELRSYIDHQKHLPEIPPAQKIHQEGVNLGEFCMSLLKKIEELSLYVLQQHDIIQEQNDRLTKLERSTSL